MIAATFAGLRILSLAGQDLLLNRAMLSDKRSPYVGRSARGWRRLPGRFPGQPQTRTRARPSIGSHMPPGERPSGREKMDLLGPNTPKRLGAGSRGGPGREHVVNQQDPGRGDAAAGAG